MHGWGVTCCYQTEIIPIIEKTSHVSYKMSYSKQYGA